jgi:hypothetical protein
MTIEHLIKINGRVYPVKTVAPNGNIITQNGIVANPRNKRLHRRCVITGRFISIPWWGR